MGLLANMHGENFVEIYCKLPSYSKENYLKPGNNGAEQQQLRMCTCLYLKKAFYAH